MDDSIRSRAEHLDLGIADPRQEEPSAEECLKWVAKSEYTFCYDPPKEAYKVVCNISASGDSYDLISEDEDPVKAIRNAMANEKGASK
jgi:hypothetical protein